MCMASLFRQNVPAEGVVNHISVHAQNLITPVRTMPCAPAMTGGAKVPIPGRKDEMTDERKEAP